jgi:uncharacterized protein YukE
MAEKIEASADAIIELTRGINNSVKQINNLSGTLSSQLRTLGSTFQDEGFLTIQGYISKTQKKVDEAVPDLETVMKKLIEYAELIKQSDGIL